MTLYTYVQTMKVIQARKKYSVTYPDLYAPHGHKNKKEFDCVQRAHQNMLENMPSVAIQTLCCGIMYPLFAAACCGIWSLGRISYVVGYSTGNPSKRQFGGILAHFGDMPLMIATFVVAYKMIA
jgi:glutathione S-transferase